LIISNRKSATATATVAGKTTSTASQLHNVETKVDIVSPTIENQPLNINQAEMKNFI